MFPGQQNTRYNNQHLCYKTRTCVSFVGTAFNISLINVNIVAVSTGFSLYPEIYKHLFRYNQLNCSYSGNQMEIITIHNITELSSYAVKKNKQWEKLQYADCKTNESTKYSVSCLFFIVLLTNLRFAVSDCLLGILILSYANSVMGTALNHKCLVFTNSS